MSFHYTKGSADEQHGEVRVFEAYLRRSKLKLTRARRELLNLVFSNHAHFTADELAEEVKKRKIRVSKATIYRTLAILLECRLLSAHDFGEGAKYYEHVYGHGHHDHFFCLVCKMIEEFQSDGIERLQEEAAAEIGFKPVRHSLSIFGVCARCAATEAGRTALAAEGGAGEAGPA